MQSKVRTDFNKPIRTLVFILNNANPFGLAFTVYLIIKKSLPG